MTEHKPALRFAGPLPTGRFAPSSARIVGHAVFLTFEAGNCTPDVPTRARPIPGQRRKSAPRRTVPRRNSKS